MPENRRNREQSETLKQLRGRLEAESNDGLKLLRNIKDNPICSLFFDDTIPCVVVTWKQYATSTQLRFIHENIIGMLEKHARVRSWARTPPCLQSTMRTRPGL